MKALFQHDTVKVPHKVVETGDNEICVMYVRDLSLLRESDRTKGVNPLGFQVGDMWLQAIQFL